uniref:Uncharacterized protein n=1 Tax=uncultured marine group II/III euryarchaeote KM3_202_G07 TaxID=1457979 RepID=A0A075GUL9_9EURY|nr:hypothetical protein [uncultured marine group II/III euryarchaeote KM3_202_G07]
MTAREPLLGLPTNGIPYFRMANPKSMGVASQVMVQGTGFEPAKHYALGPKPSPFDHSGTPARTRTGVFPSIRQRPSYPLPHRVITGMLGPKSGEYGTNRHSRTGQLGHRSGIRLVR